MLVVAASCGVAPPPAEETRSGTHPIGGVVSKTDGGVSFDGGVSVDGGAPDGGGADAGPADAGPVSCAGDPDGTSAGSRPVISEIFVGDHPFLELRNGTDNALALSTLTFDGTVTPRFAANSLSAGGYVLDMASLPASGELRIKTNGVGVFYVCWGSPTPTTLQNEAIAAGLWTTPGVCAQLPGNNAQSLHLRGPGNTFGDWIAESPSPLGCVAN